MQTERFTLERNGIVRFWIEIVEFLNADVIDFELLLLTLQVKILGMVGHRFSEITGFGLIRLDWKIFHLNFHWRIKVSLYFFLDWI